MRLGHPAVLSQPSGTRTELGDEASVWVVAKELSKLTASAFYLSLRSPSPTPAPSPSPTPAPSPSQAPGVAELQNQNERGRREGWYYSARTLGQGKPGKLATCAE
jgi:hypothetical protein